MTIKVYDTITKQVVREIKIITRKNKKRLSKQYELIKELSNN